MKHSHLWIILWADARCRAFNYAPFNDPWAALAWVLDQQRVNPDRSFTVYEHRIEEGGAYSDLPQRFTLDQFTVRCDDLATDIYQSPYRVISWMDDRTGRTQIYIKSSLANQAHAILSQRGKSQLRMDILHHCPPEVTPIDSLEIIEQF